MAAAKRICSVEGCGKPVMCKGWCGRHYYQLREAPHCSVEGCERKAKTKGWCDSHHKRWVRHGDPLGGGTAYGEARRWLDDHRDHSGDECLGWPYARMAQGYAAIVVDGRTVPAHRVMCEMVHGEPASPDLLAAHSCGKGHEGCVNPRHVRWATSSENALDAVKHGTHGGLQNKGQAHPLAKLSDDDVRDILRSLARGEGVCDLARRYDVSHSAISNIKSGRAWSHMRRAA